MFSGHEFPWTMATGAGMTTLCNAIKRFVREDDGAIEYAALAAFISRVRVSVLPGFKRAPRRIWSRISSRLTTVDP
jgi:Flp pilus assembly pilin Flp